MDDHDQPMSYPGPIVLLLARPWRTTAFHCMLLLLQRQWSLDGVLLHRLRGGRGCRNLVAFQLRQSFSNSNCTWNHVMKAGKHRQTKPFVQNAKAAKLQTFSFNLSSCPPAYGCPSTRHSSNVLLWKTSHDLQNGLCLLITLAGKSDSAQCRAVFCGQVGTFSPYAKVVAQTFLVKQLSPANLTSSIVCCSAVLSCAASLQQTLSKAGHLMGASHCVLRMLSWLHLMSLRWARGQKQKTRGSL